MFKREHHQRIARLLSSLNSGFLNECGCYFGGGTAIVLTANEYRESVDVDFLCSSQDGYRALRNTISNASLGEIVSAPLQLAREVRADRYGIRTFVLVDDIPIKLEIVSEGRIELSGELSPTLHVPVLSRVDMYAQKLLANADRALDRSTASRDIIDLAMMIDLWGPIPQKSWDKGLLPYGRSIEVAYEQALQLARDRTYLAQCLAKMHMEPALVARIPLMLQRCSPSRRHDGPSP